MHLISWLVFTLAAAITASFGEVKYLGLNVTENSEGNHAMRVM